MEILPNVHRIESVFDQRWFTSYWLSGDVALLIDSGFAFTPQETIFPYLETLATPVRDLAWLIITHASADHFGGNAAIKRRFPQVKIVAHHQDAASIASRAVFLEEHKNWPRAYGLPAQAVPPQDFEKYFGPEIKVDLSVSERAWITLSASWQVQLLPAPGHTPGHLVVFDPQNQAVYAGDAVLGKGVPSIDGAFTMPPHYFEVDWYLATIHTIQDLAPTYLLGTHYPPLVGGEVTEFLNASEDFVSGCNHLVLNIFQTANHPLSAAELLARLRAELGIPGAENQYQLLVRAHINHLVNQGKLEATAEPGKKLWQLKK